VTLAQAKAHLRVAPAITLHVDAEYVGMGDGTTVAFTLDHTPLDGSLKVYVDSTLKVVTTDYSVSGTTLTFTTAGKPALNKAVTASYDYTATTDTYEAMDDELIERLIEAATLAAERYTGRAFVQRSFTESHEGDGSETLRLYRSPVVSITSVSYRVIDGETGDGSTAIFVLSGTPKTDSLAVYVDGVLQTVTTHYALATATVTFVSAPADGAKLVFRYEVSLHVVDDYTERLHVGRLHGSWEQDDEYIVVYTAGYAATRALVQASYPDAIQAVLSAIAYLYEHPIDRIDSENRGMGGLGSITYNLPSDAKALLNQYKAGWL
jgi:hypothetical protein